MTAGFACVVCARPLDALLTNGLHAGVLVLALAAVAVLAGIGWGVRRLLREDREALAAAAHVADRADAPAPSMRGGA